MRAPDVVIDHPAWCDSRLCETRAHLVHHRSRPAVWTVENGCAEVRVWRSQHDGGEPTCQLTLCRHDVHETATVEWKGEYTEFLAWAMGMLTHLPDKTS